MNKISEQKVDETTINKPLEKPANQVINFEDVSLNNQQESVFENYIKNNTNISDLPKIEDIADISDEIKKYDNSVLNKILLEMLTPELTRNEAHKRFLKEKLLKYISRIITITLIFLALPIILTFATICFRTPFTRDITTEQISLLLEFLKYYSSIIIAEFIAMLFFIVRYVFDKSIVELMKERFKK